MKQLAVINLRNTVAIALLAFAPGAFAYLDPSTGSMILSAIVGIFATLSLAIKTYWYKLKSFFGGKKDAEVESVAADSSADPSDETKAS